MASRAGKGGYTTRREKPTHLRSSELAKILHAATSTIRRWARDGKLPAERTSNGRYLDLRAAIERIARKRGRQLGDAPARFSEIAGALNVHPRTVSRWASAGQIPAGRMVGGGRFLYPAERAESQAVPGTREAAWGAKRWRAVQAAVPTVNVPAPRVHEPCTNQVGGMRAIDPLVTVVATAIGPAVLWIVLASALGGHPIRATGHNLPGTDHSKREEPEPNGGTT